MLTAPSPDAARNWFVGRTSGISACHGGMLMACPQPSSPVSARRTAGRDLADPRQQVSTTLTASVTNWTPTSRRRRSKESASTPAGNANSSIGNRLAVCTRDTRVGAFGSSISSHCAPTVCIHVPINVPS